jgi:hypothetical protein
MKTIASRIEVVPYPNHSPHRDFQPGPVINEGEIPC